jgi:hypothetical protein
MKMPDANASELVKLGRNKPHFGHETSDMISAP